MHGSLASFIARIRTPSPRGVGPGCYLTPPCSTSLSRSLELVLSGGRPENFILTMSVLSLQTVRAPRAGTVPRHFPWLRPHTQQVLRECLLNA